MKHLNSGTTLLEVLITLLIVSIGLLGMASFQLRAVKLNTATYQYLQAANLANEMADSLVVNAPQAATGDYTVAADQVNNAPADSVADRDLKKWLAVVASRLPGGFIVITAPVDATASGNIKAINLSVCWQNNDGALVMPNDCGGLDKSIVTLLVNSRL